MADLPVKIGEIFPCSQCGRCCQHVDRSPETRFLDRGDGACRHYESGSCLCQIYDDRPDICRVDRMYARRYSAAYTWDEFVEMNLQACRRLQVENSDI